MSALLANAELDRRPAVIFNTTVTETGQPPALATTDLPDAALPDEVLTQECVSQRTY